MVAVSGTVLCVGHVLWSSHGHRCRGEMAVRSWGEGRLLQVDGEVTELLMDTVRSLHHRREKTKQLVWASAWAERRCSVF